MKHLNFKKNKVSKKKEKNNFFFFLFIFFILLFSFNLIYFQSGAASDTETDDNYYDPFIDYNEFTVSEDEEEDISFFTHGRFLSVGLALGSRIFTQTLGKISSPNLGMGILLDYFFNLRSSLQTSILTGRNTYSFITPSNTPIKGTFDLTSFGLSLKYYFEPQNLIKPLAILNPYSILGYSLVKRTTTESGNSAVAKEDASAFKIGGGIEFNVNKRKMFIGLQATYSLVQFSDEQVEVFIKDGTEATGVFLKGDLMNLLFILGVNF